MENPKTPETLEAESENPGEEIPKEASGSSGMSDIFSGLGSVSDIPDDFGVENVGVETQVVKDEGVICVTAVEDLVMFEAEETEKVCLVANVVCVDDDGEKETLEAESENPGEEIPKEASGSSEMSDIFSGLGSVSDIPDDFGVENVGVETQVVKDEGVIRVTAVEDLATFEAEETEKVCLVANVVCVDDDGEKETLEAESENPGEEIPKEASGSSEMSDIFSGLGSVSDIPDDFGVENVGVETQVVKDEGVIRVTAVEDLATFEAEETEKVCLVANVVCVDDDGEKDAKELESHSEENDARPGFNVEAETQIVTDEGKTDDCEVEDLASFVKPEEDKDKSVEANEVVRDEKEPSNVVGSPSKKEVPSVGISLYVDISGGFVNVDGRDSAFSIGDIVWAEMKNQAWWPGKIRDPIDAPRYAVRSGPGDYLLVGFYGISHFAWLSPSEVKPFHEAFDEITRRNRAGVFLGAVKKAVGEFGVLVKSEMTCSCGSGEGVPKPELKKKCGGRLGEFSAANFKPPSFLERLKYLARVVSEPRALDVAAVQNRVSAFYCSLGHKRLALHQLAEKKGSEEGSESTPPVKTCDKAKVKKATKDGLGSVSSGSRRRKTKRSLEAEVDNGSAEEAKDAFRGKDEMVNRGLDSRERKKSRYLSYPYMNFEQKGGTRTNETEPSQDVLSSPLNSKITGEKFWKKWYHGFTGSNDVPEISDMTNAASAKLLRALRRAAFKGLSPVANKDFSSVGCFFSKFRVSMFRDESADEICPKIIITQKEASNKDSAPPEGNKPERKSAKKKGKPDISSPNVGLDASVGTKKGKPNIGSPNVDLDATSGTKKGKPDIGSPNVDLDVTLGPKKGKAVIGSPNVDLDATLEPKKGKPDIFSPNVDLDATLGMKEGKSEFGWPNVDLNATLGTKKGKTKPLSGLSDVNISVAGIGVSVKEALETGQSLSQCKKAKNLKKKKGEEESESGAVENVRTGLPDLNTSSVVLNHVTSSEAKLEVLKDSNGSEVNVATAKPVNLVVDLQAPREPDGKNWKTIGVLLEKTEPAPKKRKSKEKEAAPENLPDLNGTTTTTTTTGEPDPAAKEKPEKKRKRRRKIEVVLNYPRNQSLAGTALLLTFSPVTPTPPIEDLVATFCKFGELRESETRMSRDQGGAQIVFANNSDATQAFRSLQKNNPFGAALVGFRLHQFSAAQAPPRVPVPAPAPSLLEKPAPAPPLDFIKQNLKMMTEMLEKSGDDLSQEMRAKLEGEIKGLLSKVSSMGGSCS